MTYRPFLLAGVALACISPSTRVIAQATVEEEATPAPAANNRTASYDKAYFARYAPRTALDIVRRLPGFQLDEGATQTPDGNQADIRGFAGTAGNVVVNGARPSAKSETLQTYLGRIPASQVTRVEVGPGDLYGSDYAGKNQVANLILSSVGGIDGNVSVSARRHYTGYVNINATGSVMIKRGASTINLSAATGRNKQPEEGTDELYDSLTGQLIERREKYNPYFNKDPYVAASWALERASDRSMRLNARWQPSRYDLIQDNRVFPTVGSAHDDNLIAHYRNPLIELGGDVTRPLAGGAFKVVGLATLRKRRTLEAYVERDGLIEDGGEHIRGFEQRLSAKRNEAIGRVSWTRGNVGGFSIDVGAEAAFNTLDSQSLFDLIDHGNTIPIDLPIANAKIEEKRAEAYVSVGRVLSDSFRVDVGVNYERSQLELSGDAEAKRKLSFIKPNLAIDWKPGNDWHTRLSVRRSVAQLDFYEFLSIADFSAGRVSGGNANLEPQRAWEFRLTVDRPLFGSGTVKLDLGADIIERLQDRILVFDDQGQGYDSPGNLGTGKHLFAQLTVDASLDRVWKGLRASFDGTIRRTRVDDPITHRPRNFTGYFPNWEWNAEVRRDAGQWSYGAEMRDNRHFTFYRTDEFDSFFNGHPVGNLFVEYRPGARTTLRFDVENFLDASNSRSRKRFLPNRAQPAKFETEFRTRHRHPFIGLTLKQTFGGGGVAKTAPTG